MPKPKTPNQKRKYSELNIRLAKYVALIEEIYEQLNLEAAKLVVGDTMYASGDGKPFRWSDYPQARRKVADLQSRFVEDIQAVIYRGTSEEWKNSNKVQDLLANSVLKAYGAQIDGKKYKILYQEHGDALEAFQKRVDKGLGLSDKLWNQAESYVKELEDAISCGIKKGTSAVTLSKRISKYLKDFPSLRKDYKSMFGSASRAEDCEYRSIRLAATEISMAYRRAENLRWKDMDFVVGYEIKLSDNHNCKGVPAGRFRDICDELAGPYPKGFQWIGWHPFCRCYKVPILKTEEEFWEWDGRGEVSTQSVNEVKNVPEGFNQWIRSNRSRIDKANERGTLPYFLRDNRSFMNEGKSIYISSVKKYTGSYYLRINQYLRGQRKQLDDEASKVIPDISKYISLSDKYEGVSYRGIVADKNVFESFTSLKKGDTFIEKGFMSTSLDKLVAEDFADGGTQYKIIFEIKGKNGVDISSISEMQEEKEVLFDKSSKFKITKISKSVKKAYGNIYIVMEEI